MLESFPLLALEYHLNICELQAERWFAAHRATPQDASWLNTLKRRNATVTGKVLLMLTDALHMGFCYANAHSTVMSARSGWNLWPLVVTTPSPQTSRLPSPFLHGWKSQHSTRRAEGKILSQMKYSRWNFPSPAPAALRIIGSLDQGEQIQVFTLYSKHWLRAAYKFNICLCKSKAKKAVGNHNAILAFVLQSSSKSPHACSRSASGKSTRTKTYRRLLPSVFLISRRTASELGLKILWLSYFEAQRVYFSGKRRWNYFKS